MKFGYSILLGENLPATEIAYGDCANEQIVCPECRSPVFKTVRPEEDGRELHYLSHYRRDDALGEDCSLRVDSSPRDTIERDNAISRKQTLELFMAGIRTLVGETVAPILADKDRQIIIAIERQKAFSPMFDFLAKAIGRIGVDKLMAIGQSDVISLMERYADGFTPGFGHAIQLRIATDMLRTMLTPGGRSGFETLVRAGYMVTALTANPNEHGKVWKQEMRHAMVKAARSSRGKATSILTLMERFPADPSDHEAAPGANRLERMFDVMLPAMAAILYRADYRGFLLASTRGTA